MRWRVKGLPPPGGVATVTVTTISEPTGLYFTALRSRFSTISRSEVSPATTRTVASDDLQHRAELLRGQVTGRDRVRRGTHHRQRRPQLVGDDREQVLQRRV